MLELPEALWVASAGLFGAAIGSFLNVCIYRLPRDGLSLNRPPRSFCPSCGYQIPWYDNIPLLSWIVLGGRCRSCRGSISIRYFFVEALTAMLFAVVVHRYVVQGGGSWGGCLAFLLLTCGLIVAAFVDIDLRIIPDEITVGGMHLLPIWVVLFPDVHLRAVDSTLSRLLLRLEPALRQGGGILPDLVRHKIFYCISLGAFIPLLFAGGSLVYFLYRRRRLPQLARGFWDVSLAGVLTAAVGSLLWTLLVYPQRLSDPRVYALSATLAGMLTGSGLVFLVGVIGTRVFRKPAMGFGDVKLMGLLGGFAGWWGALAGFFLACLLGSLVGVVRLFVYKDRYLPFGPFLCIGAFFLALWPQAFLAAFQWYLELFRG
jgi:leader peptidase (prepilin peptidase)/N-methyltransferase